MFKQTEEKYKNVKLGFGTGSLYAYGCYLVSLVNGLNSKGYKFTPEGFNDQLKKDNLFIGDTKNLINVDALDNKYPQIFKPLKKIEPFGNAQLKEAIDSGKVVIAKVSAVPVGGNSGGTHFVLVVKYDGKVATIFDPWFGEEVLVTKRYSKHGNLLGLRVFDIIPYKEPQEPPTQVKTIKIDEDLPTWVEEELKLKSYEWYDKKSSITTIVDQTNEYYEKSKEVDDLEEKVRKLELEKIELTRKMQSIINFIQNI